jgi:type II secretory pathway component PulF
MKTWQKILLFQLWFFVGTPMLFVACQIVAALAGGRAVGQVLGDFLFVFVWLLWFWEWYAYAHYRHCRQEEFLFLVQTAAATQAPLEQVLRAYLNDRPREHLFRAILLFFVFPGYYWIHITRSFDARLSRLLTRLEHGVPLDRALAMVPGIASRETALAATVGQYSGKLGEAMKRFPDGRTTPMWMELAPRLLYPLWLLCAMASNVMFLMIFIIPKFQKIFLEFRMKLPYFTELLIAVSDWCIKYPFIPALFALLSLGLLNAWLFSSTVRWHLPVLNWFYRMKARGEFLQMLGIMLETGKPLDEILERMLESNLLSAVVQARVAGLLADLTQGQPLAESLARHELATAQAQGLIASAQKSGNLTWALQELGDTLMRRSARFSQRAATVAFPMMIFGCAVLIAFVALSLFLPLTELIGGMSGG